MEQPYIYKYRPQHLKDFVVDNNLTNNNIKLCETFIKINKVSLLIVGEPGTGKTSLINSIINDYYGDEYNNINIMSINSLKEQGISYYRNEVKTFCQTMSTINNKKKFLILDDIDILNEQSQQVFRNCIDKYSNNVNFLLSCSNIQKVIDSLQSRLFIIKLNNHNEVILNNIFTKICLKENITIDNDAKEFIINISNNSLRTLINYLEKLKLINKNISYNIALETCSNITFNEYINYTTLCKQNKLSDAILLINLICERGYSVIDIYDDYFLFIKITDILSEDEKYKITKLLSKYITIFYNIHEDEIELSLFTNNLINILNS